MAFGTRVLKYWVLELSGLMTEILHDLTYQNPGLVYLGNAGLLSSTEPKFSRETGAMLFTLGLKNLEQSSELQARAQTLASSWRIQPSSWGEDEVLFMIEIAHDLICRNTTKHGSVVNRYRYRYNYI